MYFSFQLKSPGLVSVCGPCVYTIMSCSKQTIQAVVWESVYFHQCFLHVTCSHREFPLLGKIQPSEQQTPSMQQPQRLSWPTLIPTAQNPPWNTPQSSFLFLALRKLQLPVQSDQNIRVTRKVHGLLQHNESTGLLFFLVTALLPLPQLNFWFNKLRLQAEVRLQPGNRSYSQWLSVWPVSSPKVLLWPSSSSGLISSESHWLDILKKLLQAPYAQHW